MTIKWILNDIKCVLEKQREKETQRELTLGM